MDVERTGSLIARRRKEKGLTQKDLAEKLCVSDRAVSKWERGLNLPNAELFEPLCEVLDISVMELLRGEQIPQEQIAVAEAEAAVSAAAELARLKERRAKWLRRCSILLACLVLFAGGVLLHGHREREEAEAAEQVLFAHPAFWPKVTIEKQASTGKTEIINGVTGALYYEGMPQEQTLETAQLAINEPEEEQSWGKTRTIELDDELGYDTVTFSLYGEKKDLEILVYRWPREQQGTDVGIKDGERVPYEPARTKGEAGKWSMRVESGYVYAVIITWEGTYFAEYPFKTESVYG